MLNAREKAIRDIVGPMTILGDVVGPSVSFIDPNFIDEPDGQDNDDGAPSDIAAGQNLIGRVVNAVVHSPQWNKTLLLITYDEHGGFYDHVNPLDPRFRDKAKAGVRHRPLRGACTRVRHFPVG